MPFVIVSHLFVSLCLYISMLCLSVSLCVSLSFFVSQYLVPSTSLSTTRHASLPSLPFPSKRSLHPNPHISLMCCRLDSQSAPFCLYDVRAELLGEGRHKSPKPNTERARVTVRLVSRFREKLICVRGRFSEGPFNECVCTQLTRCPHFLQECQCPDRMF